MKIFGIVNILRDYCTANGIQLLYGSSAYRNAIADRKKYEAGDLILLADFRAKSNYNMYIRTGVDFVGMLALGRVREETTRASLNELYLQKYDRRLEELGDRLEQLLTDITCPNDLDITTTDWRIDLNKLDLNADFVYLTLTLRYE